MLKNVLIYILILASVYVVIGAIKTLFFYLALYLTWRKGGRKPIRMRCVSVECDENGSEINGTEITEEVAFDSPYEVITDEVLREEVYERLNDRYGPALAHLVIHGVFMKMVFLMLQFTFDTFFWPTTGLSFDTKTENEPRSE